MTLVVKNPPANAVDIKDKSSIPWSGRYPEEGNGNTLQYSCLKNSMDRGVCQAPMHPLGCKELDMTQQLTHSEKEMLS